MKIQTLSYNERVLNLTSPSFFYFRRDLLKSLLKDVIGSKDRRNKH